MTSGRTGLFLCGLVFASWAVLQPGALAQRPGEGSGPTTVEVGLYVLDIDDVDSASQTFTAGVYLEARWSDPAEAHDGSHPISKALRSVWNPRLQIVNQQRLVKTFDEDVEIAPEGEVIYRQRYWGSFSQPLDLADFPFDQQSFELILVSAGYSPDEVSLVQSESAPGGVAPGISVADWELLGWATTPEAYRPLPCTNASALRFTMTMDRYQGYYIYKVILPLILIVMMSWIVFWIDPSESGTQISVSVTAVLTLIAYRFAVGSLLPKVSYMTRLDSFIFLSTLLVFVALFEVVVTASFAREQIDRARRLDRLSRVLFPAAFVVSLVLTLGSLV